MVAYKQDMPPPGGYAPIIFERVPLKPGLSIYLKYAIALGIIGIGWVGVHEAKKKNLYNKIEMRCGKLALVPMLLAEVDRMNLKQFKKNRDAEEKLMKDNKDWEVGKWKGLPVYVSLGPNDYFAPAYNEYVAHTPKNEAEFPRDIFRST